MFGTNTKHVDDMRDDAMERLAARDALTTNTGEECISGNSLFQTFAKEREATLNVVIRWEALCLTGHLSSVLQRVSNHLHWLEMALTMAVVQSTVRVEE